MSKKQSSTPHDALFKLFLRQPDTARDFLAFHLPAPIHALCDMKTLKLESSSFIDDDLRESYSDDCVFSFQGTSSRFSLAVSKLYLFLMQVFIAS